MERHEVKKFPLIPALLVAALLLPVSVAPGRRPQVQDACAGGKCCFEPSSICLYGDSDLPGYYYDMFGRCTGRGTSSASATVEQ